VEEDMGAALKTLVSQLAIAVKRDIVNTTDSYMEIALRHKVSLTFVNNRAKELKRETGYSRGRGYKRVS
jgi:hypothetical protein